MGGNWKLNPTTVAAATSLVTELSGLVKDITTVDTVIFPPFPLINIVKSKLEGSRIRVRNPDTTLSLWWRERCA